MGTDKTVQIVIHIDSIQFIEKSQTIGGGFYKHPSNNDVLFDNLEPSLLVF